MDDDAARHISREGLAAERQLDATRRSPQKLATDELLQRIESGG